MQALGVTVVMEMWMAWHDTCLCMLLMTDTVSDSKRIGVRSQGKTWTVMLLNS